jgi:DmsE family decaheme c-type cytochrome
MKCPSRVKSAAKPTFLSSSEVESKDIVSPARCQGGSRARIKLYAVLILFAAGLASVAPLGFAQPARAEALKIAHEPYSALVEFVQRIEGEQPKLIRAEEQALPDDPYSALADFVQRLEGGQLKLAATEKSKADPWDLKAAKPAARAVKKKSGGDGGGEPTYVVGSQVCAGCHAGVIAAFGETLMGKIGKVKQGTMECENCHGPGSAHVKAGGGRGVGGIISFRPNDQSQTAEENNAVCLRCHDKGDRTLWQGSTHEERGLTCTNCHTVMKNVSRKSQLKTVAQMDTCFQCHKNKRAEIWRTSHMPVREGKMTCTSCHNPHGSFSESLLKEATVNDTCYKCHAEKRGPFLWEHPPVRESCLNCHDPHGSNNDFLLKISRPRLCQQCHAGGQHNSNPRNPFNTLYAQNRECQHCHSNHHGSNNPAGPRFMR